MSETKKIFIDTDCGIDDAVAIMLALSSPEVDVTGISCVAGNTDIDSVIKNVCGLLSFFCRTDIPVYRGFPHSLIGTKLNADDVHGKGGLGGVELEAIGKRVEKKNALDGLLEAAKANPGLTLVTLGPLTNIAAALNLYPQLKGLIGEIVVMGGAIGPGNVTKYAEFNFAFDPEAVTSCLSCEMPMKILTWDATVELTFTEKEYDALDMGGSEPGDLFLDLQRFYMNYKERTYGKRVINFPDPLTMACVIDPDIITASENMGLRMVLDRNSEKRGASLDAAAENQKADGKAQVITECSRDRFTSLIKRIKDYPC
ncbi:MAG: nucleoside hydrolase [Spirochaetales bacterium]|nr:nucleoside hydrolase [Spirochaetales bacterium]